MPDASEDHIQDSVRPPHCSPIYNHHLINPRLNVAPFESLIRNNASRAHVEFKEAHPTNIAAVATVTAKAGATTVTHPEGRFVLIVRLEHAVVIDMVTGIVLAINPRERFQKSTYWPQLTKRMPSSTRASLKPELNPGAVGGSDQFPLQ